ncbi:hypothetical protein Tco_1196132, partial [Tanacetum coccineum]
RNVYKYSTMSIAARAAFKLKVGWEATDTNEIDGFGFVFGAADSLLTRTDVGTCNTQFNYIEVK